MILLPFLAGAVSLDYLSGGVPEQQKLLFDVYKREYERGNFNIIYDKDEGIVVDFKNREVYFIDSPALPIPGQEVVTVRAHIDKETMRPVKMSSTFSPTTWFGKERAVGDDERVDVYWRGLFNKGIDFDDDRVSNGTTGKRLTGMIESATLKFEQKQQELLETQEKQFMLLVENVHNLSEDEKKALKTKQPSPEKIEAMLTEFKKLTGIDSSRYDQNEAFTAMYTCLKDTIHTPLLTSNSSPEFVKDLKDFHKLVHTSKLEGTELATVLDKLDRVAPNLLADRNGLLNDGPDAKPSSIEKAIAQIPYVGQFITNNKVLSAGLACIAGGLVSSVALPFLMPVGGAALAGIAGSLIPLAGVALIGYAGCEYIASRKDVLERFERSDKKTSDLFLDSIKKEEPGVDAPDKKKEAPPTQEKAEKPAVENKVALNYEAGEKHINNPNGRASSVKPDAAVLSPAIQPGAELSTPSRQ